TQCPTPHSAIRPLTSTQFSTRPLCQSLLSVLHPPLPIPSLTSTQCPPSTPLPSLTDLHSVSSTPLCNSLH
ncbi:unnamed protein product, partial [Staurois parvus]